MSLTTRLRQFFAPPVFPNDDPKTRRAQLLVLVINTIIIGIPLIMLGNLVSGRTPVIVQIFDLLFWIAYLALRWWLHRGQVGLVSVGVIVLSLICLTALLALLGTIRSPTILGYVLLVVAAGLLFDRRGIILTIGLSLLAVAGLIGAENAGWLPAPDYQVTFTQWVTIATFLTLGGGLTYFSLTTIRQTLHRADQELATRQQMEEALRRQNQMLSSLHHVTLDILKRQAVDELLTVLAVRAADLLDAPYGEILVLDGETLVTRAATSNQSFILGDRAAPHEALLSWRAVTTREPAILDDYSTWPHHRAIYNPITLHAVADFPILQGDRCLGVLSLGRDRPGYVFDQEQVQTGELFAQLAALVLDNAQLYAAAQAELAERIQTEKRLRQSNATLQLRNEELDAFAHTVAHDLKSPLSIIIGYADLLLDGYDDLADDTVKKSLRILSEKGRKASSIIEALLLFAGVRQQEVPIEPIDTARLIEEALQRLAKEIHDTGAVIHQPDRSTWPVALGYAPWVEEIWVNYLNNAITYGGQPPQIELSAALQPDGLIRFNVRDNGAGLTSEQHARLFVPFERLGQTNGNGHGLGLSIVRRIADKLDGQVGVESNLGQGSTFYFTLPAADHRSEACQA